MKYGIDYDGTIADTNAMKVDWIRRNLDRGIEPWKTDRTTCVPLIGIDSYNRMAEELYERSATLDTPPIPGAIASIIKLSKAGEIFLVTARLPHRVTYAQEWLEKQGVKDYFSGFETAAEVKGATRSKEQICEDLGLDVLIDDDERHLREIKLERLLKILFKSESTEILNLPGEIEYARSWPEVLRLVSISQKIPL